MHRKDSATRHLRVKPAENLSKELSPEEIVAAESGEQDSLFSNERLHYAGGQFRSYSTCAELNRLDSDEIPGIQLLTADEQDHLFKQLHEKIQKQFVDRCVSYPGAIATVNMALLQPVPKDQHYRLLTLSSARFNETFIFFSHHKASNRVALIDLRNQQSPLPPGLTSYIESDFSCEDKYKQYRDKRFGLDARAFINRKGFKQNNAEYDFYLIMNAHVNHDALERMLQAEFSHSTPTILSITTLIQALSLGHSIGATVMVAKLNNHPTPLMTPVALCAFTGGTNEMYTEFLRNMYLPMLRGLVNLKLDRDIIVSVESYLATMEFMFAASHDANAVYANFLKAKWIYEELKKELNTSRFFASPLPDKKKEALKSLHFYFKMVGEYYPIEQQGKSHTCLPNFPQIKERIKPKIEEVKGLFGLGSQLQPPPPQLKS